MMIWKKALLPLSIVSVALVGLSGTEARAQAGSPTGAPTSLLAQVFNPPDRGTPPVTVGGATRSNFNPPDRGAPPSTLGGASRGSVCGGIVSLMPATNLGLTVSGHPSFHWYLPETEARRGEFLLLYEEKTETGIQEVSIYETWFEVPEEPGIISLKLPEDIPELESGKLYHWYLALRCNPARPEEDAVVEGWVERVEPEAELTQKLDKAKPIEQANAYAENGIWQDSITVLANLMRSPSPSNAARDSWNTLLGSVGLEEIAAQPTIDCCSVSEGEGRTTPVNETATPDRE